MPRPPRSSIALPARLGVVVLGLLVVALLVSARASAARASGPERIVSLNPSLTAIVVALGAGERLVGVDDYSATKIPEVAALPRVGGLFSPSLEAVVALRPDRVVLVPSAEQRDFRTRLEGLGVPVTAFENLRFSEVLENIRQLGAMTGRSAEAAARIQAIVQAREAAQRRARGRGAPGVVVVLQRDPVYVVGSGNFIDEMLSAVGGKNLASEFDEPYPRVAAEWVVARAPEVLIDLSPDPSSALAHWSHWPSIPAVARGRVLAMDAELISLPGPHLDRAFELLAASLYPVAPAENSSSESDR